MRSPLLLIIALNALVLSSCTARQIYAELQENHRRQCLLLPVWQQAHCLSRNDTPWEDYSSEREEAATAPSGRSGR